jgi:hypothetical protein
VEAGAEQEIPVLGARDFNIASDDGAVHVDPGVAVGVAGFVEGGGEEAGFEAGDFVEFFQAHDGKGGGAEAVFPGVLSGPGFSFRGAGAGRALGVGAVGGEAPGRNGFAGAGHE